LNARHHQKIQAKSRRTNRTGRLVRARSNVFAQVTHLIQLGLDGLLVLFRERLADRNFLQRMPDAAKPDCASHALVKKEDKSFDHGIQHAQPEREQQLARKIKMSSVVTIEAKNR
jgi:hypothetical protein